MILFISVLGIIYVKNCKRSKQSSAGLSKVSVGRLLNALINHPEFWYRYNAASYMPRNTSRTTGGNAVLALISKLLEC